VQLILMIELGLLGYCFLYLGCKVPVGGAVIAEHMLYDHYAWAGITGLLRLQTTDRYGRNEIARPLISRAGLGCWCYKFLFTPSV
jgi:hypothetical protein